MIEALAVVSVSILAIHAVLSHGAWFAGVWLLLTGILGGVCEWRGTMHGRLETFSPSFASVAGVPLFVIPFSAATIYLGALLSKGFVERTPLRGSIAAFVVVQGLATWVVLLPFAVCAQPAGWLPVGDGASRAVILSIASACFGLAYRLVSERTEDDRVKFLLLAVALPVIAVLSELVGGRVIV